MRDDIISYREMCDNENVQTLQRGMNYRLNPGYSVILMSQRSNAPYKDKILGDGITIEYEGHDAVTANGIDPKQLDQPHTNKTGSLTQNGLFAESVNKHKEDSAAPELVRVYEKIMAGVWSDKGYFELIDYRYTKEGKRSVFKFYLIETDINNLDGKEQRLKPRSRIIPSNIKKEVWKRDGGRCVICGATDELHFDHNIPFSKGGTSIYPENVQILCARHNLKKSDNIE